MQKICGLALTALVLVAAPSRARGSEEDEVARAHFLSGQAYYDQANYDDALREFQEAYRVSKRPALLYNLALCHERLGHLDEAVAALESYLAEDRTATDRASVESRIRNLKKTISERPPPAPAPRPAAAPAAAVAAPPLAPKPATPPRRRRVATWVVGALSLGMYAGGVVSGAIALDRGDRLHSHCPTDTHSCMYPGKQDDIDTGNAAAIATDVLWPVATGALVTAVILYFLEGRPARAPHAELTTPLRWAF
jgi:hypothetical protein